MDPARGRVVLGAKDVNAPFTPTQRLAESKLRSLHKPVGDRPGLETESHDGALRTGVKRTFDADWAFGEDTDRSRKVVVLERDATARETVNASTGEEYGTGSTEYAGSPERMELGSSQNESSQSCTSATSQTQQQYHHNEQAEDLEIQETASPSRLEGVESHEAVTHAQGDSVTDEAHTIDERISAAKMLRLRLRVAMFKVNTDQITTPLERLQIVQTSQPPTPTSVLEIQDCPEGIVRKHDRRLHRKRVFEAERRLARLERPIPSSNTVSHPWTTAIEQRAFAGGLKSVAEAAFEDDDEDEDEDEMLTPKQRRARSHSPPSGRGRWKLDNDVSSSGVKGRAATSLLMLGGGA